MIFHKTIASAVVLALALGVSGCSRSGQGGAGRTGPSDPLESGYFFDDLKQAQSEKSSIWDIFGPNKTENTVQVNRYLWAAALDVLNFLPIESVDPFTGVIVTGYGTPPGGGRAYRATVHIKDPSLTARSLNLSLQTRGGPVSAATTRAVEDAILARARQLRVADENL